MLILALVLSAACWALVASPVRAAGDVSVSPLRIDGLAGSHVRRTIRLAVTIGACTTRVDVARLVQGRTSVHVRLTQTVALPAPTGAGVPTICPAVGILRCVAVVLAEPLGKRSVVDLTSGTRFRLGSAPSPWGVGFGHVKSCSPPGRV